MATRYENLLDELRTELRVRRIGYNRIIRLINRQEYDEIRAIVDDYGVNNVIDGIITEREVIGNMMTNILNNLDMLNNLLRIFNEEPQPSLTKARKLLKHKVFINIYDLVVGRYEMRTTKILLIRDVRSNPDRVFPLKVAKRNRVLKCFLRRIF
jgi:hypothetical protein